MELLKDRRVLLGGGAALAVIAGLGVAFALMGGKDRKPAEEPPASRAGLIVETGRPDDTKLNDPARPLRCFVGGQFVGETTLAECAKKNGVATGALDVGVDETGALAAADQAGTVLTPLPPPTVAAPVATAPTSTPTGPAVASAPLGVCQRYSGGQWNKLPGEITQNACIQQLFAGKCERPGGATYGRWGDETLRLLPGRVEASSDNRSFHLVVEQAANCAIPSVG
ncbi:hypothetical protein V7S57_01955 [Caulobacter sp. CCNWLY153]|uniref:Uncharacterized protein n=1 Tax=Caulobacter radicis TaxID=2172650 RepID=A0A2T9JHG2_9CAUL|nr:hypothetical protein [Caulobacter radicis]PVM83127.1 hypothetical protein DDF65_09590 [Caulobacter radicis]